ncbi:DEAD/DEAH box helicase [Brevibacillus brevis]|uniref:DEAD/DEAH box helicase n=1 Tax=Brevibacillus brevis TaxID=1393 RepID=UPI0025A538C8|nr:helicase-related protein [Brevibacillus brevis]WJQ81133.1 helicase-related protein [Brevibacillus brevis]
MHEYLLYIKVGSGGSTHQVQAYVTPSFSVDCSFWKEREGCELHVIGKTASLALAFSLREKVNGYLAQHVGEERMLTDGYVNELRSLAATTVCEASRLYGRDVEYVRGRREQGWFTWEPIEESVKVTNRDRGTGEKLLNDQLRPLGRRQLLRRSSFLEHSEATVLSGLLNGRALFWDEIETLLKKQAVDIEDLSAILHSFVLANKAEWRPGIRFSVAKGWLRNRLELVCERCGSVGEKVELTYCHTCEQGCAYCTVCLGMGKSKCCTPYFLMAVCGTISRSDKSENEKRVEWTGKYSADQSRAAERARSFVANPRIGLSEYLIWAVCGAGKTELLFPSIEEALVARGRVLIATPRKDVVLELAPRIRRVFPKAKVIAVHGSSTEKWEESDITIATTHQVMRYYKRFSLVVLDEVDAFPYHNDPVLYRALSRAVESNGKLLYLSATPPKYLRKRLMEKASSTDNRSGVIPLFSEKHVLLPGRYHGSALPVPKILTVRGLHKRIQASRPVYELIHALCRSLDADRQVFVFVPRVAEVERVLEYLQIWMPLHAAQMTSVHAADPMREEKVEAFRKKRFALMVTTTILERGVTIPKSDVVVLGAEVPVFDEASLVQIAGRVGRSIDDPTGSVLFLQADRANAPKQAVRQITQMNQLAQKLAEQGVFS